MSRSERLLTLLQLLRRHRFAVSATQLAQALDISVRTVEVHRARVFDKMEVKSAVELANLMRGL